MLCFSHALLNPEKLKKAIRIHLNFHYFFHQIRNYQIYLNLVLHLLHLLNFSFLLHLCILLKVFVENIFYQS